MDGAEAVLVTLDTVLLEGGAELVVTADLVVPEALALPVLATELSEDVELTDVDIPVEAPAIKDDCAEARPTNAWIPFVYQSSPSAELSTSSRKSPSPGGMVGALPASLPVIVEVAVVGSREQPLLSTAVLETVEVAVVEPAVFVANER